MSKRSQQRYVGGYLLVRRLGAGGSGTVWEAEDGAGHRVALKLLHPTVALDEASRRRLAQEARLVNQVRGPGISRVIDYEADDAEPFIVMEFVEGPTLSELLTQGPLPLDQAADLADELLEILTRVHTAEVVHRDLKPSNVIMSEKGPRIIDFGIAQEDSDERLTKTGLISGTPGFVSPELLSTAGQASFETRMRGDWWAWSALVLNAITGRPPFGSGHPQALAYRLFQGDPDVAGLPPQLQDEFRRALAVDLENRIGPDTLALALRQASAPESGVASVDTPVGNATAAVANGDADAPPYYMPQELAPASGSENALLAGSWVPEQTWVSPQQSGGPRTGADPVDSAADSNSPFLVNQQPQSAVTVSQGAAVPGVSQTLPQAVVQTPIPYYPASQLDQPSHPGYPNQSSHPLADQILPQALYLPARLPFFPLSALAVLFWLAVLPTSFSAPGLLTAALVLVVLSWIGAGSSWMENRRTHRGSPHSSDLGVALALFPRHILTGTLQLLPGLAVGAVAGAFLWFLTVGSASVGWETLTNWLAEGSAADPEPTAVWLISLISLTVAYLFPVSKSARRGLQMTISKTAPNLWVRGAVTTMLLGGALLLVFLMQENLASFH